MFKRMTCPSYLFQNSISFILKCFQTYSLFQKLTCQSYAQDLTKFRHFFAGFEVPCLKSSRYSTLHLGTYLSTSTMYVESCQHKIHITDASNTSKIQRADSIFDVGPMLQYRMHLLWCHSHKIFEELPP